MCTRRVRHGGDTWAQVINARPNSDGGNADCFTRKISERMKRLEERKEMNESIQEAHLVDLGHEEVDPVLVRHAVLGARVEHAGGRLQHAVDGLLPHAVNDDNDDKEEEDDDDEEEEDDDDEADNTRC